MSETIEGHQPVDPSPENDPLKFERVEKAEQKIIDHLKDTALESPRFQAFADFVDFREATSHMPGERDEIKKAMIEETIRQRKNGVKGYKTEFELIGETTHDYWQALASFTNSTDEFLARTPKQFALGLRTIKDKEIDKRNQQPPSRQ
jgi:hypothetical protein